MNGFAQRLQKLKARPTLAFGLFLALALIATHPGVFFGSRALFFRDYGVLGYGFVHHYREAILDGELPLWNHLSNCGQPFLGQWGTLVLYPLSLIMVIFPMPWALGFFCLLHLWIGGMGMRKLALDLKLGGFAAALAGTLYTFNGATLSSLMWPNYTVALGWLPWVLWSVRHAWTKGGRWTLGAAVLATLQMLTGVPEVILFTWFIASLWMLADIITQRGQLLRYIPRFLGVILLVSGLSAAQLLPFFETLELSHRVAGFGTNNWSIPWWGWVNLFVPMIRQMLTYQGTYFQEGQEFVSTYYFGAAVMLLAIAGLFRSERRMRWLWAGVALLGMLLAIGGNLPGYATLRAVVPVWSLIRFPVKFIYLAVPALVLLAAFGWQSIATGKARNWLSDGKRVGLIIGIVGSVMLLVFAIAWAGRTEFDNWPVIRSNTMLRFLVCAGLLGLMHYVLTEADAAKRLLGQVALLAVLVGEAALHFPKLNPTVASEVFAPNVVREYQKFPEPQPTNFYRVFITPKAEAALLMSNKPEFEPEFFGRRLALWSNLNLLDGMPKLNGSSTLPSRWEKEVEEAIYSRTNNPPARLVDFLGARFESSSESAVAWVPRTNALPLVTAVERVYPANDEREVLRRMTAPDFDPLKEAWLFSGGLPMTNPRAAQTKVSNLVVKRHEVTFRVEADQFTAVVIAQSWHPAWKATINGEPTELIRANHAFQAVVIGMGRYDVRLVYEDEQFITGCKITLMTALLMIVGIFVFAPAGSKKVKPQPTA